MEQYWINNLFVSIANDLNYFKQVLEKSIEFET